MTKRIQRINRLLKEELGKILLKEESFPKNCLATITRIEASPDLKKARVWISVFPEDKTIQVLDTLNKKIYQFQQRLNEILNLKTVPKIRFLIEKKTKSAARIEELLEKVKKKKSG